MPTRRSQPDLAEYQRKRDFKLTAEPAPATIQPRTGELSYLIQKHDATRLHYDFRLELDGVLLSWAVTKGPSLNPADKRLAVRTEDHPLAHGKFEGTIPQGQYGGGTVMLWDRGTWEPIGDPQAGLAKGHLSFTLRGERLKGGWELVRMRGEEKRENWLLIKHKDAEATSAPILEQQTTSIQSGRALDEIAGKTKQAISLEALMKRYPEAQLATLVDQPPQGDDWVHELKFDGHRLLGYLSGGEARLVTRNGNDWTRKFPSIRSALEKLTAREAVLDMEAVVLDRQGKSDFQALQAALSDGGDAKQIVAYVFDLLHFDGESLMPLPLVERKQRLEGLLKGAPETLRFSEHVVGQGKDMIQKACESGLEGIISKSARAPYVGGRQKGWLKTKCQKRQEFIILGYSSAKSGGRALGALYLGYWKGDQLQYAGKVGTGFTMGSAQALTERLRPVASPTLTKVQMREVPSAEWKAIQWVKPDLLGEVSFTEWTQDGRIPSPIVSGLAGRQEGGRREAGDAGECGCAKQEEDVAGGKRRDDYASGAGDLRYGAGHQGRVS